MDPLLPIKGCIPNRMLVNCILMVSVCPVYCFCSSDNGNSVIWVMFLDGCYYILTISRFSFYRQ